MAFPFLFFKVPEESLAFQVDITQYINAAAGETITSIVPSTPLPTSPDPLAVSVTSGTSPVIQMTATGGDDGISYGFNLTVTTSAQVLIFTVAVTAQDPSFVPYITSNPNAFQDLVDEIQAGNAAIASSVFAFPAGIDPAGGFVTWELLASDGTVYAAGNAFEYKIIQNGLSNTVISRCVVSIPSTVPPSLDGQKYQLRYTLALPQESGTPTDPTTGTLSQNTFFQFENIRVVSLTTVPLGTQPSVELQGVNATVSLVTEKPYDNVTVEIWAGTTQVAPASVIQDFERTANGFAFAGVINTSAFGVSLVPYQVIWKYWASTNPGVVFQESADLFVINPSIMNAVNDVKDKINKARTTLYGRPDLLYPNAVIMTWLRRGADAFNGAYGQFTSFTMINALGPIREFWLLEAELSAIRSQYLAEGEKAFDFQGAAISLEVDRTQYLDTAAQAIENLLDQQLKLVKQNLIIKGNTSGDGSVGANAGALAPGAIGAVGITITPANMFGRFSPSYGLGGWRTF
jgi:hypothetical protein